MTMFTIFGVLIFGLLFLGISVVMKKRWLSILSMVPIVIAVGQLAMLYLMGM
ncbi:hypothetical protein [Exiguobacterium sp. s131]|uniref:hypothetical protein n=1 Tax=Exiguobacterium sp. s131 TaxID=2751278 RepID=UPI001BEC1A48|nr:hypothetical protein [Exiguobacterium sp. s131]